MVKELYQRLIKNRAGTIYYQPILDGEEVTPTSDSATITVVNSAGNALPTAVTSDAATIATNGRLSFAITAANAANEDIFKATWKYTYDSVVRYHDMFYRVVKSIADELVSYDDLVLEMPKLSNVELRDTTWRDFIDHHWNFVQRDLRNRGLYSFLILRSEDLYYHHLYYTLAMACSNFSESDGDSWDIKYGFYMTKYTEQMNQARLSYDSDNDGLLTDSEDMTTVRKIGLTR